MPTPKQIVYDALEFNSPQRVPSQLWVLPWAEQNHPEQLKIIQAAFPDDIIGSPSFHTERFAASSGDIYEVGEAVDEWGCVFTSIHKGVIGEVKQPLVEDEEWGDADNIHIPWEALSIDVNKVNAFCREKKDFFITGGCCPRPFERLQFIRGTEQLYVDLMLRPDKMFEFINSMHKFYCEELSLWAKTDVDALNIMDDWGSQNSLLINPKLWEEIFKPMYKDYMDIAHSHCKKIFMHSDGYILDIYPHLIELGLDAINSQIFCMEMESLKAFKGQICFWGEIDRQHLLPNGSKQDIYNAVAFAKENLYQNGGCIAQCEFGPGAKPENVYSVFDAWRR